MGSSRKSGKSKTPSSASSSGKKKHELSSLARHGKKLYKEQDDTYESEGSDDDDSVNVTGYMSLDKDKKKGFKNMDEEEDEEVEEVFDLGVDDSEEDDDDEDEDQYEEGSEEEDEAGSGGEDDDPDDDYYDDGDDMGDYDEYADDNMKTLLDNLPAEARNKILSGKKITHDDDSDDTGGDSGEEDGDEGWGRKKSNYYSGDTADLEIGQDVQDAEDEEAAVRDLHQQTVKKMKESDFYDNPSDDDDDEDDSDSDEEVTLKKKAKSGKSKTKGPNDKLQSELHTLALGAESSNSDVQVEKIERNIEKMSKNQKFALVSAESPELLSLVKELEEKVSELKNKITPIKQLLQEFRERKEKFGIDDDIINYLDVKNQLLLAYCMNLCFYLAMKCEGRSVKSHPVMRQLLELRYVMEKLRPMDGKLKHQIDRLLNFASLSEENRSAMSLRADPGAFMDDEDEEGSDRVGSDDSQDNNGEEYDRLHAKDDKKKSNALQNEIYRAPKIAAAPYKFDDSREDKEARKMQRKRNKLKNSAIFESLQEEFGTAPEQSSSTGLEGMGTADAKALQKEIDERNKYEEERMIRLTMTRKEKQSLKKRSREANKLERLTDIGDIDGIDEFDDLKVGRKRAAMNASSGNADATAAALRKAVAAFTQSQGTERTSSKKRNKVAPDFAMDDINIDDGDDEFSGIVEDFSNKKKAYESAKAAKFAPEPRYGGLESPELEEGQKRPATYEMIKNRGLTPHRKKANRNPRVKKREAYAKAVKNRRGQVRDVISGVGATNYAGQMTGIKASLSKSRKINN